MEYSIQKLGGSQVEISFSIDKSEWDECIQDAFNKNKHKYKLEGFRAGKVPFNLLVNRYGTEIFYEDAMDIALNKYYSEILDKEKDLDTICQPEVDVKTVDDNGLSAVFTVAVMPEFKLGQYKGLKLDKIHVEVTEEEIDKELNTMREKYAKWEAVSDRSVKIGDKIILDYSGSVDDVQFEGGTAEKQTLEIGSGQFIPGFEEQLVGANIGESVDVKVKFPDEYHSKDLSGKDAVFKCVVHEIREKIVPELDDEFAKDIGEFDTFAELRDDIKSKLFEKATEKAKYTEENMLIEKISNNTTIDIPDVLIDSEVDRMINDFSMRLAYSGLKFDDFLKYTGKDIEAFKEEYRKDATDSVKSRLILESIIREEKITVTKEMVDKEIEEIARSESREIEEMKTNLKENEINQIMNKIIGDELFAFLRANNSFE